VSLTVTDSQQYHVNELVIVSKVGNIDISPIFLELNLYDSIFIPTVSGNIVISDATGLSSKLIFDGSESLLIDISKSEGSEIGHIKKAFRIYKQTDRRTTSQSKEQYVLNFVSDELLFSDQQRVNQSYRMPYTQMVERILIDYLKVPATNLGGIYEPTAGVRDVIIPNLRPIEAIQWVARKSVNFDNSPGFVFFQNLVGYNFCTISKLLSEPDILDIKFQTKNLNEKGKAFDELSSARAFEVVAQNDAIAKQRAGVNAGTFIGFDPITRMISRRKLSYLDHYENMNHSNRTPNFSSFENKDGILNSAMYDSRIVLDTFSTARQLSDYVKTHDPESLSYGTKTEDYAFQRKAIFENLNSKRLKLVMPGNFQLSSGFNVNVNVPFFGEKDKNEENRDKNLSGRYLITSARHILKQTEHESIIEVASTTSENDDIISNTRDQNDVLESYQ